MPGYNWQRRDTASTSKFFNVCFVLCIVCTVCVLMCTVMLPSGINPVAVKNICIMYTYVHTYIHTYMKRLFPSMFNLQPKDASIKGIRITVNHFLLKKAVTRLWLIHSVLRRSKEQLLVTEDWPDERMPCHFSWAIKFAWSRGSGTLVLHASSSTVRFEGSASLDEFAG
jgi:hypothetical protein